MMQHPPLLLMACPMEIWVCMSLTSDHSGSHMCTCNHFFCLFYFTLSFPHQYNLSRKISIYICIYMYVCIILQIQHEADRLLYLSLLGDFVSGEGEEMGFTKWNPFVLQSFKGYIKSSVFVAFSRTKFTFYYHFHVFKVVDCLNTWSKYDVWEDFRHF